MGYPMMGSEGPAVQADSTWYSERRVVRPTAIVADLTVPVVRAAVARQRRTGLPPTLRWRRQSRANPSLKPNSLLAGKIQGILFVGASECDYWLGIQHQIQWFASQFPTHRNREFISA